MNPPVPRRRCRRGRRGLLACGQGGLELAYLHGTVTALWRPAGVGMAVLILYGRSVWPGIVLGDLAVADFSQPAGTVLGQTIGNTLES
jgi:integral membrane sensor domain MASE1